VISDERAGASFPSTFSRSRPPFFLIPPMLSARGKSDMARAPRKSKAERDLERDIKGMEAIRDGAVAAGSWSAATQAGAKISSLRSELENLRDARLASKITDPLERVRHEIRKAEAAGSWQAAARLAAQEAQLIEARERAQREANQADDLDELGPDDLLVMIEAAINGLPDVYLEAIRDQIASRLGFEAVEK